MNPTQSPPGIARFDLVVLDCPEPQVLAEFYSHIFGWEIVDAADDWVTIRDPARGSTGKAGIAFQLAPNFVAPTWPRNEIPQQSHLDLDVTDLDIAEAIVLAAGATATGMPEGVHNFRVYLDPAGHPFCLCKES